MARKLFIVSRDHPGVLESLKRAVAGEHDVEVICDRRQPGTAPSREQVERRAAPDSIDAQLRDRGFAVVHLAPPAPPSTRTSSTRPSSTRPSRFRF